jgi:hypothetical protein
MLSDVIQAFFLIFPVNGEFLYVFVLKNIMIYLLSCNQNESIAEAVKRSLQFFPLEFFFHISNTEFSWECIKK